MRQVAATPPRVSRSVWTLVPWILGWLFLLVGVLVTPKFEEMFRDFGVALPGLTIGLLNVSRVLHFQVAGSAGVSGLAGWAGICVLATASFGLCALQPSAWQSVWRIAGWIFLAVVLVGMVLALGLPLLAMQQSLQGGSV